MTTQEQLLQHAIVGPRWRQVVRVLWYVLAVLSAAILIASLPGYVQYVNSIPHGGSLTGDLTNAMRVTNFIGVMTSISAALVSIGLAGALFYSRARERIALFLSFYLLVYGIAMTGVLEAFLSSYPQFDSNLALYIQTILLTSPTIALFALLPDGRFVPGWSRWVVLGSIPIMAMLVWLIAAGMLNDSTWFPLTLSSIAFVLLMGLTVYAQVYRYRRVSSPTARQQAKWVAFGLCVWVALISITSVPYIYLLNLPAGTPVPWWVSLSSTIWWLSQLVLPVSFSVAVFRYRLYNIDLIINRTIVYGTLTACTILLYVVVVGSLGVLFQSQGSFFFSLLATGFVAVLFHPLRQGLQRRVNRLMYGDRLDPIAVLEVLSKQLEYSISPRAALTGIVETLGPALKLPYAAVEFGSGLGTEIIAAFGKRGKHVARFPIVHQQEEIGSLVVSLRPGDAAFSDHDKNLLETIARQAGATAQATKLTADLQNSRQRLVNAREEERRRLRRDLHDGLGPQLASQTLALDALEKRIAADPAKAISLLQNLKDQSQSAIHDIRQLVYDLRPPTLDELGLAGALGEMLRDYQQSDLTIDIQTRGVFPPLPAAVEVAAYRITQEALTNVVRHADATICTVQLDLDQQHGQDYLRLTISDNGKGLPAQKASGIGMLSMRERAEELGGRVEIDSIQKGGTQLTASLPFPREFG